MSEYRKYIQGQNQRAQTGEKKKKHRGWIFLLILVVALYFYVSKNIDIRDELSKLSTVDAISILTSNTFGNRELPIYSVETDEKQIALSFDAAWGSEDFKKIMDILDKHKVKVTFFMTGSWVDANPECVKELVKRGHDLGNHSEHHYDMTTLSKADMTSEITEVHDKVKSLANYEMMLFRPPYGAYNNDVINTVKALKYYPIQWSVDSLDWKDYGTDSIISTVCNHKNLGPGAIILCHNGAKYTAEALDTMLSNLEKQGYSFVKISDLIIKDDYHMDANGRQLPLVGSFVIK